MKEHVMPNEQSIETIFQSWQEISAHPEQLMDMSEKQVMYAAGGGLPLQFGLENSQIWQGIVATQKDGATIIAGVEFTLEELERMGRFYRFLSEQGFKFHCIDERLADDLDHLNHQVHDSCGACNATGATTGLKDVEGLLLGELNEDGKQSVYKDMHHHVSLVINVDLAGARVAQGNLREELKQKQALPFNASIALDKVAEWSTQNQEDGAALVDSLVKWNVQIARNIIGGDHNALKESANETVIITNLSGLVDSTLLPNALSAIQQVSHKTLLEIK